MVTLDMHDGLPVLVKSSRACEVHSGGDYREAMRNVGIFPDILLVDLNGAFGEDNQKNREIIKSLASTHYAHSGGGLRSLTDVEDVLKSGVRRCVVASTDDALIKKIPKDRLIVELSVNKQDEVLVRGRKTNTGVDIITRISELIELGVQVISITFVETEGHLSGLPRVQLRDLLVRIPHSVQTIYIAGGISTLDDLECLWSFPRVTPQFGSAIRKSRLSIGSIYRLMV
jgi:phosphoribosylformimino-5-aminoimidazole carboxamide ribonucleotide (ProFAR) isomerase